VLDVGLGRGTEVPAGIGAVDPPAHRRDDLGLDGRRVSVIIPAVRGAPGLGSNREPLPQVGLRVREAGGRPASYEQQRREQAGFTERSGPRRVGSPATALNRTTWRQPMPNGLTQGTLRQKEGNVPLAVFGQGCSIILRSSTV